jgi:hypothetical protein
VLLGLGLTPRQAVDRVLSTATDIGLKGRDDTFGAGLLDLGAATAGLGGGAAPTTTAAATAPRPTSTTTRAVGASSSVSVGAPPTVTVQPTSTLPPKLTTTTQARPLVDDLALDEREDDEPSKAVPAIVAALLIAATALPSLRRSARRSAPS